MTIGNQDFDLKHFGLIVTWKDLQIQFLHSAVQSCSSTYWVRVSCIPESQKLKLETILLKRTFFSIFDQFIVNALFSYLTNTQA